MLQSEPTVQTLGPSLDSILETRNWGSQHARPGVSVSVCVSPQKECNTRCIIMIISGCGRDYNSCPH